MWEYLNFGDIVIYSILTIMFLIIIIIEKGKAPASIFFLLLIPVILYWETLSSYKTALNNIELFNKNKTLLCVSISNYTNYNISKKNGWKLYKNYFTNDIYSIRVDSCKEY